MSNTLKYIGWAGTAGCGLLAAKGLGEFLPASQHIAWAVGGGLEALNIATIGVLSSGHKGNRLTKLVMSALVASTIVLDIAGVAGQLSHGYQSDLNSAAAVTAEATAKADAVIAADKATIANIDHQFAAVDAKDAAANAMVSGRNGKDTDAQHGARKVREEAKADRAALNTQRAVAVAKLAEDEARKGEVAGATINASSEFASAQFIAKAFDISQDRVIYAGLGLMAVLAVLFPVCLMVISGHGSAKAEAAPVVTPVVTVKTPVKKDSKRSEAGRKGWETRRRNQARKNGRRLEVVA